MADDAKPTTIAAELTDHYRDQLLDVLMYVAQPETRLRLMHEVPAAYNAYLASRGLQPVVTVIRTSDGTTP